MKKIVSMIVILEMAIIFSVFAQASLKMKVLYEIPSENKELKVF